MLIIFPLFVAIKSSEFFPFSPATNFAVSLFPLSPTCSKKSLIANFNNKKIHSPQFISIEGSGLMSRNGVLASTTTLSKLQKVPKTLDITVMVGTTVICLSLSIAP
jgi:hypothetical protein